eukprot:13531902-Ditylum_brightwellii.AAC.1
MNAIFESDLLASRSKSASKGYKETFSEFVLSLKAASSKLPPSGPIDVDTDIPAVTQLWPGLNNVIYTVKNAMKPFLKLFGVEEGNDLSPFAVDINSPHERIKCIQNFFKTPKRDGRDNHRSNNATNLPTDASCEEEGVNQKHGIVPNFVKDIQSIELDEYNVRESNDIADAVDNDVEKSLIKGMKAVLC